MDFPPYYLGELGKLPRPVLLIHGIESDFKVWGVQAKSESRDSADFKNGLVKSYDLGSLPDLLAASYGLNTDPEKINENGIYFYQAPSRKIDGKRQEDSLSWNADNSQSKYLYDKIKYVLDNYSEKWKENEMYKIDLVAHSQGGLIIREMLRGLRADGSYQQGLENAANHINRVITVNTPHFGSSLAIDNANEIVEKYPGVTLIIEDLDSPKDHLLVEADLNTSFWEK